MAAVSIEISTLQIQPVDTRRPITPLLGLETGAGRYRHIARAIGGIESKQIIPSIAVEVANQEFVVCRACRPAPGRRLETRRIGERDLPDSSIGAGQVVKPITIEITHQHLVPGR